MKAHVARVLGALGLAAVIAGCGLRAPAPAPGAGNPDAVQPAPSPGAARTVVPVSALISPKRGKFFGLEADHAPDSLTPVIAAAASLGRQPDLLGQYVAWKSSFDAAAAARSWSYGALYYAAWEPYGTTEQAIADGGSDAYITRFARAVRNFREPVAISFGHEMNGNWYPWGTEQTPASAFVAAWRHVHGLFTRAGAGNVIWIWNPNIINPMPDVQLRPYWPGRSYVNWVGLTGYFATTGPHTFASVYGPTMTEIRRFTSDPFIIAETAVETGPNAIACVNSLVNGVERHASVVGLVWFDFNKDGVDWTVEDRPDVRAPLASALAGLPLVSIGA
ncbi:MAG: beta-mannanase [Streptosporangiaceae bacterium]|nr:beta-mannanase [Streptosporangiaceae bacterium]MBV9853316.1 beta-mannanase [Streptosporangiaceae bacterium]